MKKKLYCCNTVVDHEIFETPVVLYTSIPKLKKKQNCWKECGISEITVTSKVITPGLPYSKRYKK